MFVRVQPRRVTVYRRKKQSDVQVLGFATYQYLELAARFRLCKNYLEGRGRPNPQKLFKKVIDSVIESDKERFRLNPNALACFLPERVFPHTKKVELRRHAFLSLENCVSVSENGKLLRPFPFRDLKVNKDTARSFQQIEGEWINPQEIHISIETDEVVKGRKGSSKAAKAVDYDAPSKSIEIIEHVADEDGTQQLLRFIKSIPKIKFNLTGEQDLMISTAENLLCLGRSGTGKTTSSALRLFASDAFFKYHEQVSDFKVKNPDKKLRDFQIAPAFMESESGLRLLFVSASPVLVNEVKRFYLDLKVHLCEQLQKRLDKKMAAIAATDQAEINPIEGDPVAPEEEQEETEQELLAKFVDNALKELERDEQIEKQAEVVSRFDNLNQSDYPLFLTVKRLILMLDASTLFPFFARDSDGKQIGLSGNLEWSNEQGGVFMINQYFKQAQQDLAGLEARLGQKILDIQSALEVHDQLPDDEAKQQADESATKEQQIDEEGFGYREVNARTSAKDEKMVLTGQNLSFEVDFDVFEVRFWPKVAQQTKLTPLVAWTEICSEIKGRVDSFKQDGAGIPAEVYIQASRKKKTGFLTELEKSQIYHIFLKYEQWKQQFRAYDQNDVVNHILRQINSGKVNRAPKMHFLMVDEVQDLTQNLISLLMTMAEKNIFFTGDTAQTIAKGVGFRFYDLKSIFDKQGNHLSDYQTVFRPPKVLQLTKNFRSHAKILDCANSVVALLELLFPKTIDKLRKEKSDIDGPKPIIIEPTKHLERFLTNYLIWGADCTGSLTALNPTASEAPESTTGSNDQSQFGCDRVVIVRDQDSKARVPAFLKNVLCLTVYEAKGLEFEEVILFNFFNDTKCGSQWKLLNEITAVQSVTKRALAADFLDFDMLDCEDAKSDTEASAQGLAQEAEADGAVTKVEGDTEVQTVLTLKTEFAEVYRKFAQVCTELKLLYVAITRPKKFLLIYDEEVAMRTPLQKHWSKIGVVETVSQAATAEPDLASENIKRILRLTTGQLESMVLDPAAIKMQWRVQGFKLFKGKLYMAAKQCFENSEDQVLVTRCLAYESAGEAMRLRGQSEAKVAFYKDKSNYLKAHERNVYRQEARELMVRSKDLIRQAGHFFKRINMDKHAAQCFYSGDDNDNAVALFIKLGQVGQAAESYLQLGKLREAANLFAQAGLFANAFECYERLEDWDGLIQCLHRYKDRLDERERSTYVEKYFPIALNSVYQLYANLDPDSQVGMTEDNKGKVQQMRLRLKFQKSVSIIREEISDAEEEGLSESSEEQEMGADAKSIDLPSEPQPEKALPQEGGLQEEESKEPASQEVPQDGQIMIDTGKPEPAATLPDELSEEEKKESEDSFQVLSDQGQQVSDSDGEVSFEVIQRDEAESQLAIGHRAADGGQLEALSQIDPDDEFLKSEHSYSLIEKLSEQNASFEVLSAHSSEFSILSGSKVHSMLKSLQAIDLKNESSLSLPSNSPIQPYTPSDSSDIMSLLNSSRYSIVGHARDTYAEDIVIQKVIYYVSLFKGDVREALLAKRSKDQLAQVLLEVESEQNALGGGDGDPAAREFEEDMDFMMIELDEIAPELLGLILDTLEHYELYRLCLVICGRYSLQERVGRFVSAVSQKYSNLHSQRINSFSVKTQDKAGQAQAQAQFSLIAHEAMHNVISMASSCGKAERGHAFREGGCFETLFLHGFWKKLIYMVDVPSSLQLCMACNDFQSFKLNYLVEKRGITQKSELEEALNNPSRFNKIVSGIKQPDLYDEYARSLLGVQLGNFSGSLTDFQKHTLRAEGGLNEAKTRLIGKVLAVDTASFLRVSEIDLPAIYSDLLTCLHQVQKAVLAGDNQVTRSLYSSLGISYLDGLDLFDSFSNTHCLVSLSHLYSNHKGVLEQLGRHQSHFKSLISNKSALALQKENLNKKGYDWAQPYNLNFMARMRTQVRDEVKELEQRQVLAGQEIALACDLNLDLFLVPKQWAKEAVFETIATFTENVIKAVRSLPYSSALCRAYKQACWIMKSQQLAQWSYFESKRSAIRKQYCVTTKDNLKIVQPITYERIKDSYPTPRSPAVAATSLDKRLSLIQEKAFVVKSYLMSSEVVLTRNPTFAIASQLSDAARKDRIYLAHQALQDAMAQLETKKFFGAILQATLLLIREDFYIPVLEALTQARLTLEPKNRHHTKLGQALELLDAHVYQKVNDYQLLVKAQLGFIRNAFKMLGTAQVSALALQVFYQSVFSVQIFAYKITHGGVLIRFDDYTKYVEPGCAKENAQQYIMPKLVMRPATMAQVVECTGWIAALCQGIAGNTDDKIGQEWFFEAALYAVITLTINLSSQDLLSLKQSIITIVELAMAKKGRILTKSQAQANKAVAELIDLKNARSAKEVKQITKQLSQNEALLKCFCKVLTREADRKTLLSDQTKSETLALINEQLEVAGQIEASVKQARAEAAAKIQAFWERKRAQIVERKQSQRDLMLKIKRNNEASQSDSLDKDRHLYLLSVYDSDAERWAASRVPSLCEALDASDSLARSLVFLLGSIFVRSSLDQQFVAQKLRKVQSQRRELSAYIQASYSDQCKKGIATKGVWGQLAKRVDSLLSQSQEEKEVLQAWLMESDGDTKIAEQKRQNFRKMEKWTSVFTYNKAAAKKRSLLSKFGARKRRE